MKNFCIFAPKFGQKQMKVSSSFTLFAFYDFKMKQ